MEDRSKIDWSSNIHKRFHKISKKKNPYVQHGFVHANKKDKNLKASKVKRFRSEK